MAKKKTEAPNCFLCQEAATDIVFAGNSLLVHCLDCGTYEILELAAEHIQEIPLQDRLVILDRAKQALEGQDGPPLIREPFIV